MKPRSRAASYGRIGGLRLAAHSDPRAMTKPARDAWLASFEQRVDPDGVLAPPERARRAALLRRAHMTELSIRARRARGKHSPSRS